jgi:hypothetical protein
VNRPECQLLGNWYSYGPHLDSCRAVSDLVRRRVDPRATNDPLDEIVSAVKGVEVRRDVWIR